MLPHGLAASIVLALLQAGAPTNPVRGGPAALELRVHVRDAAGAAVPGCAVRVWRRAVAADPDELEARGIDAWSSLAQPRSELTSDARGELIVSAPASGLGLELRAELPGRRARAAWKPGDPLELALVARASHDLAIVVRDDADQPLAGCGVALYLHLEDGALMRVASARSDAQGRAVISDVEGRWLPGTRAFVGLDGVELPPVELELERAALPLAQPLELTARASPALTVQCLDSNGAPYEGLVQCSAALADADGAYTHWTRRCVRGPNFELARVPEDAAVMLSLESARAGSASAVLAALAPAVEGAAQARTPRRAELRLSNPTSSLGGVLLAPDGRPLGNTWLRYALNLASPGDRRQALRAQGLARTDESGRLWLAIGPSSSPLFGQLTLCAEPADASVPGCSASIKVAREQGQIHLDLGALATRADVLIAAGRVVAADGAALANATVVVTDALPGDELRTTSDRDGRYELWGFARQELLRFEVRHAACLDAPVQRIEPGLRDHEVVLQRAARLRGRVLLPDGAAAQHWRIRAIPPDHAAVEAELGADGRFEVSGFPAGPTRLALCSDVLLDVGVPLGPYEARLPARDVAASVEAAPDDSGLTEWLLDYSTLVPLAFEVVDGSGAGVIEGTVRGFAQPDRPFVPLTDGRFVGWASEPEVSIDVLLPTGKLYAFHGVVSGARLTLPTPSTR